MCNDVCAKFSSVWGDTGWRIYKPSLIVERWSHQSVDKLIKTNFYKAKLGISLSFSLHVDFFISMWNMIGQQNSGVDDKGYAGFHIHIHN